MSKWKYILSVALLVILGAMVGSLATQAYFKRWFRVMGASPQTRTEYIMEIISRDLKLSPQQENRIREIVERSERGRQKMKALQKKKMADEIKMELNSDQQQEWESLRKKAEKNRRQNVGNKLHQ